MTRQARTYLSLVVVAALLVTGGVAVFFVNGFGASGGNPTADATASSGSTPDPSTDPGVSASAGSTRTAAQIGKAFLADWVTDGRVVRRDQGDDTVSEGQAYGMLIAVGIGDEKSFDAIWSWTRKNLQRSDHLLAWQWDDGKVVDDQPASDADLDAARALVLAGKKFGDASFTKAGTTLATAIADKLTVMTPDGRVLLPGLWAQGTGPWSYNSSYAAPASFSQLEEATGDKRFGELVTGSRNVTTKVLASAALPSDWSQIESDGSVVPLPSATGNGGTVEYGYNAARLPLRYSESCDADDVALAAKLATPLEGKKPLAAELDLGGSAIDPDQSPLGYAARAAAEASAGDSKAARRDLASADELARRTPTYFGSAWDALAALQLETDSLGACTPLTPMEGD